ncbi:MAG: putative DNA-binding domain-containing protein [Hyphomicrobiaceae bacterium]
MNWRKTQNAFAAALRDPTLDVPEAVGPREQSEPVARFNVYRNNTAVSLTEAIADSYPVVRELVGDEFFTALARAYTDDNVPVSPVLIHYGDQFPDFISGFKQLDSLPFLADVARVEWSWVQAYHAADQTCINADALQSIDPDALNDARLELHPSVHLPQSDWPAISIWSAHQIAAQDERQEALGNIAQAGECGLIVRPEFEVNVQLVQPAIAQLLASFRDGATLGDAADQLEAGDIEHFGGMLGYIFSTGAITAIHQ